MLSLIKLPMVLLLCGRSPPPNPFLKVGTRQLLLIFLCPPIIPSGVTSLLFLSKVTFRALSHLTLVTDTVLYAPHLTPRALLLEFAPVRSPPRLSHRVFVEAWYLLISPLKRAFPGLPRCFKEATAVLAPLEPRLQR